MIVRVPLVAKDLKTFSSLMISKEFNEKSLAIRFRKS